MSQNHYSVPSHGRNQGLPTQWSAWEWNTRGYWESSRLNSQGSVEYKYEDSRNAQATGESAAASSSSNYYTNGVISHSQSDGTYDDAYRTSGGSDTTYSSADPYEAIPRSEAPQAGASNAVSNYQPAYPSAGNSYRNASTIPYDLGRGLQGLSLEPVGSSTGNEYGNHEYAPTGTAPGAPPNKHITKGPDGGDKEVLDSRYCTVPYDFWEVGRVFMMLWTEPAGVKSQRGGTMNYSHISKTWLDEDAFSEIRRFVVVRDNYGNCSCLAIHTYNNWATLKHNLPDPENHAIIYTTPRPPAPYSYRDDITGVLKFEKLLKDSIKVNSERTDKEGMLDEKSRINYTKTYTVEKDVRVLNIGKVDKRSLRALLQGSPFKESLPNFKPSGSGSSHRRKPR